ncbi:kinase-like domain-containing protein [Microdochium trichocladiopsis]|uniref:non-specific serine/threonine protein kinase n=1 Tax=Microdochium trichocladiopsis TaxID=1682393 RepID=A0A9P9BR47_9PEZI|nr:kinase-like domain-containing protein [Microdochium trichocladiopsis]KAH7031490.1 kinase-like domain-containing protein [Microdochium trichocladiopsis]
MTRVHRTSVAGAPPIGPQFVIDSTSQGGHRHSYSATTDLGVKKSRYTSPAQVDNRLDKFRSLLTRANQKFRSFQPEHHHFGSGENLFNSVEASSIATLEGCDRATRRQIGREAFGTVSVVKRAAWHRDRDTKDAPLLSTETLPQVTPSPSLDSSKNEDRGLGLEKDSADANLEKHELVAVKQFRRRPGKSLELYRQNVIREFELATKLRHPNIVCTWELIEINSADSDENDGNLGVVMEYCEAGDLYQLMRSRAPDMLCMAEADCLFKQLMLGVEYLHVSAGVAHCDIKPENLLITYDGRLKIADFGCSQHCRRDDQPSVLGSSGASSAGPGRNGLVSGARGSEYYKAPEQHVQDQFNGPAADIWACGVTYLVMRVGRRLWPTARMDDQYYAMYIKCRQEAAGYPPIEVLELQDCRNIIYCMLDPVAKRRITISQALKTDWARAIQVCNTPGKGSTPG